MGLSDELLNLAVVYVRQRKELAELFGFETRNKYSIEDDRGRQIGFVAEQQKGILGFFLRQSLGHWRRFDLHFYDSHRQEEFLARHPFRIFFQRLELANGKVHIGAVQRRWSILTKRFDLHDANDSPRLQVSSPFWKIWTFPVKRDGKEVAVIRKKWGGGITELFTDADTFRIEFHDSALSADERMLIVTATIYSDLLFFEKKAGGVSPFRLFGND